MTVTVVTGWSPAGWNLYGKQFVETFDRYWPKEYRLHMFVEEFNNELLQRHYNGKRVLKQTNLAAIPGCMEFLDKYRFDKRANGKDVQPHWKPKTQTAGYNFRFDAWKFCRQGFIPYFAAKELGTGLLCWLDGDVVSKAQVPSGFLEGLLPEGKHIAYLGRDPKHSEIGFQLYRVPEALPMLQKFSLLYRTEAIFELPEWHSAYAFDAARKSSQEIASLNLTPGGSGDVWLQSALAPYSTHLKGKRKGTEKK